MRDVEGKVNAHSTNGGINLVRGSGEVKLESQNGGIVVRLPEGGWAGELLEARSQNGGLILQVPEGFNSGIEAELPPTRASTAVCLNARRIELNLIANQSACSLAASPLVHVSTRNGSLQIMSAK